MTGINTSLGINSVASTIAALGANGTQIVTTNTGAHVTGLEAAAYEFGSILASYPADGPPLTRNAAVFQVSDEDGNITMMSLNDLADEIRTQLGFDPLLEFSAGIGATSNGYSIADINHILNQIETRYSSMTFTQLTQVQGEAELEVGDGINSQVQGGLTQLQGSLSNSIVAISNTLVASPNGVSLDQDIVIDPGTPDGAAAIAALGQLPGLSQSIATDLNAVSSAQALLSAAQSDYSAADQANLLIAQGRIDTPHWPNKFTQAAAIVTAQNNLTQANNALTQLTATSFAAPLSATLVQGLNGGLQGLLSSISSPANQGQWTTLEAMTTGTSPAVGHFFMTSANLFAGASPGRDTNTGNIDLEIALFNDRTYIAGALTWDQAQAENPNITLDQWLRGGSGAPAVSARPQMFVELGGNDCPPFNGLISACGLDPNDPADVAQFNAVMEELVPGITAEPIVTAQQLLQLKNALNDVLQPIANAQQNITNAQQTLTTAQNTYNSAQTTALASAQASYQAALAQANTNQTQLINSRQQALNTANQQLTTHRASLTSALNLAMSRTDPAATAIKNQIQATNTTISANQATVIERNNVVAEDQRALDIANAMRTSIQASITAGVGQDILPLVNDFLGTNLTSVDGVMAALDQRIQTLTTTLATHTQQRNTSLSTLQASLGQLQTLQTQLLNLPNQSFSDLLTRIGQETGIDLTSAIDEIVGGGALTAAEINNVIAYINENLLQGQTPISRIPNAQLQQIATTQLQSALSQASFTGVLAASPDGVSANAAVFTIPGTAGQVSFNQLLATIQQTTGADLATPINSILDGGLITNEALIEIHNAIIIPHSQATQNALAQLRTALAGIQITETGSGFITPADQTILDQNRTQLDQLNAEMSDVLFGLQNAMATVTNALPIWPSKNETLSAFQDQINLAQSPAELEAATISFIETAYGLLNADYNHNSAPYRVARENLGYTQLGLTDFHSELAVFATTLALNQGPAAQEVYQAIDNNGEEFSQIAESISALQAEISGLSDALYSQQFLDTVLPSFELWEKSTEWPDYEVYSLDRSDIRATYIVPAQQRLADYPNLNDLERQLSALQERLSDAVDLMQKNLAEYAELQSQLLVVIATTPAQDMNLALSNITEGIAQSTGVNLSAIVSALTGDSFSLSSLGLLNTYLSSPTAAGQTPNPISIGITEVSQDFSEVDDNLNNFTVDPRVETTLDSLGIALSQLSPIYLDDDLNLSIQTPAFEMPLVAQALGRSADALVSFEEILNYELQSRGVDLLQALPNLIDDSGNISLPNLRNLVSIINQAVPFNSNNLTLINGIQASLSHVDDLTVVGNYDHTIGNWFGLHDAFSSNPDASLQADSYLAGAILGVQWASDEFGNTSGQFSLNSATYANSLAGLLGIPQPSSSVTNDFFENRAIVNLQYDLVCSAIRERAPNFDLPDTAQDWTPDDLSALMDQLDGAPFILFQTANPNPDRITDRLQSSMNHAGSVTDNGTVELYTIGYLLSEAGTHFETASTSNDPGFWNRAGGVALLGALTGLPYFEIPGITVNSNTNGYGPQSYNNTIAGILGVPRPVGQANLAMMNNQYQLVKDAFQQIFPSLSLPDNAVDFVNNVTLEDFQGLLNSALAEWGAEEISNLSEPTLDIVAAKTALQNIQFADVEQAINTGTAAASVTASMRQGVDRETLAPLSAAEINSQLEDGDLYVNSRGQFFLNRQPTNARDASVAAFVISGTSLNDQLANLMNKVNLNNTRIQMANYLSAATSAADLQTRIAEQRTQYGFADIMSVITGGSMSDSDITSSTDITTATGDFQSALKTAINNATNNQDLDTQNLQQLTSQIQANNTAMTQIIQSFEQMLKGLSQNLR